MAYAEIGKNIRAARKQLNMSREELAEKSGLSAKFIAMPFCERSVFWGKHLNTECKIH